jgi:hypothetical protein
VKRLTGRMGGVRGTSVFLVDLGCGSRLMKSSALLVLVALVSFDAPGCLEMP